MARHPPKRRESEHGFRSRFGRGKPTTNHHTLPRFPPTPPRSTYFTTDSPHLPDSPRRQQGVRPNRPKRSKENKGCEFARSLFGSSRGSQNSLDILEIPENGAKSGHGTQAPAEADFAMSNSSCFTASEACKKTYSASIRRSIVDVTLGAVVSPRRIKSF